MGYNFIIGNAEPEFDKSNPPFLRAEWVVGVMELENAPQFPGDEMTGKSNLRCPSYGAWSDFCKAVDLYDFFYDDYGHLHAGHPGCTGLTQDDAAKISSALSRYRARSTLPPGFDDWQESGPAKYDPNLARLIWLDFWVQWAVKNCDTPAIQNS